MWTTVGRRAARIVLPLLAVGLAVAPSSAWAVSKPPAPTPTSSAAAPSRPGATTGPVTFGIAPASADRPDDRSFLELGAAAGSVAYDHLAVMNQSDVPLDLDVYAVNSGNTSDGSLGFTARGAAGGDSSWIRPGASHVTVPAQSPGKGIGVVIVPVTITVPKNAEPGDHVIGVVASLTTVGRADSSAPGVQLEQRTGVRVYVDVQGEAAPSLKVTDLRATYDRGPLWGLLGRGTMHVSWTVTNDGNVRYAVQSRVGLRGPSGLAAERQDGPHVVELVPGGRVKQSLDVPAWPLVRTSVTVTAAAGVAPGGRDVTLAPASATVPVWTVPWVWLAVLVLGGLTGWVIAAGRRRYGAGTRRRPRHAGPQELAAGARRRSSDPGANDVPTVAAEPVVLRSSER